MNKVKEISGHSWAYALVECKNPSRSKADDLFLEIFNDRLTTAIKQEIREG